MATVGLYDADLISYGVRPFNLELMKIASYYKQRRDLVGITDRLTPDRFTKFFYRQDILGGELPRVLHQAPNLTLGGHAFSGAKYKPLPEEVEAIIPDPTIYYRAEHLFRNVGVDHQLFRHNMSANHLRISMDDKTVWDKCLLQLDSERLSDSLIIHDYNLAKIDGAQDFLRELPERFKRPYVFESKFPILIEPGTSNWLKWFDLKWGYAGCNLRYLGLMADTEFADAIDKFLSNKMSNRFEYVVTYGCNNEDEFFEKCLKKVLFQSIYAKVKQVKIRFTSHAGFFSTKEGENLLKILSAFTESGKRLKSTTGWFTEKENANDTVYRFIKRITREGEPEFMIVDDIRAAFALVRVKNYNVFDGLYQQNSVVLKGGEFVDERQAKNKKSDR